MHKANDVSHVETTHGQGSTRSGFRPDIEGLRAVAVLAVILFHAEAPGVGGGYVGVDVFFVISGFLITGMLWREAAASGTVRLSRFYGARARRLLPASATVGVVTLIASALLLPPLRIPYVIHDGIASALYVGNYWFILDDVNYFADLLTPSPFQHYWSLGVEEQFYLLWPPLIIGTAWMIRRVRRNTIAHTIGSERFYRIVLALVVIASFSLSLVVTYWAPAVAFFSLPTRAWELSLGGLVALSHGAWRRLSGRPATIAGWAGLGLILVASTTLNATTRYPGTAALVPVLGAVLVIGAGTPEPARGCGRVLAMSPMRAIGRVSYSWYLWHWPVLVLAPALCGHALGLAARLTAALLSGALAVLTLRFIENPLRFAPRVRRSPAISLTLGAAVTALSVCVGVALMQTVPTMVGRGAPAAAMRITVAPVTRGAGADAYNEAVQQTFAQVQESVATAAALNAAVPSNLTPPLGHLQSEQGDYTLSGCVRTPYQEGQPECAIGDTTSSTRVALVGDSHAAMWIPAFQQIATQRHWRLEIMGKMACPPMGLAVDSFFRRVVEHFQHCEQWRTEVHYRLRAEHPQLVIVSVWRGYGSDESLTGFTAYNRAWIDSLARLVRELRFTGARVLVLGPIPSPHSSVPICVSGHLDDVTACTLRRSMAVNESGIAAEDAATRTGGGAYADLSQLFCTTERCPVIVGSTLVYIDVSHLTLEYSRLLAPAMGALADRTLAPS